MRARSGRRWWVAWGAGLALAAGVPAVLPAEEGAAGAEEPAAGSGVPLTGFDPDEFGGPAHEDWLWGSPFRLVPRPREAELPRFARGKAVEDFYPGRRLVLTYDDGPFPDTTGRLLDILRREGVPAVFFLVGGRVQDTAGRRIGRQVVRRMVADGHLAGNHSWNHPHLPTLGEAGWKQQITKAHQAIRTAVGYSPTLFRPPYGRFNPAIDRYLTYRGYTRVMWSYAADEFRNLPAPAVARGILRSMEERERGGRDMGGVLLLHDAHGLSVDATELLIRRLRAENCRLLDDGDEDIWRFVGFHAFYQPDNAGAGDPADPGATAAELEGARGWCRDHAGELEQIRKLDEVVVPSGESDGPEESGGYG